MNAIISSKWPVLPAWDHLFRRFWKRWEKAVDAPWPGATAVVGGEKGGPQLGSEANASAGDETLLGATISLPWQAVRKALPEEFLTTETNRPTMDGQVILRLTEVLPQLTSGKVQISLGKLRQAAPVGRIATTHPAADDTLIELPLAAVLACLNPQHLPPPGKLGASGTMSPPPGQEMAPEFAPPFTPPLPETETARKLPPTRQEMLARQTALAGHVEAGNPESPAKIALL